MEMFDSTLQLVSGWQAKHHGMCSHGTIKNRWENSTKMDLVQDLVQWLALLVVLLRLSFLLSQSSLGLTESKNEYQKSKL
jgi:hypothetical protein